MLKSASNFIKMNLVTEGGSGGGPGNASAAPAGGSGSQAAPGDSNSQASAGNQAAPAGNPIINNSAPSGDFDWKSALPKELQEEPSLKLVRDINGLAKGYVNAQKLIGADKIVIPSKHATADDWKGVYQKLGLPADIKDYPLTIKEGVTIDKDFTESFKKTAFEAGVLPKQAQALADWFGDVNKASEEQMLTQYKQEQGKRLEALKTEWGAAFETKANHAKQVISELASPDLRTYLEDSGLATEPRLIQIFADIYSKFMKEDTAVGSRSNAQPVMTPKDADSEISKIMSQVGSHPYFIKDHPGHAAAVAEMQHLYKLRNPDKSPVDKTM